LPRSTIVFSGTNGSPDTWSWDGSAWTHLLPVHQPSARSGQPFIYDPTRGALVLYGADTWLWNGSDWIQLDGIQAPSLMIAPTQGGPIAIGGSNSTGLADFWRWDTATAQWQHTTMANHPSYRILAKPVYDAVRDRVLLFGGVGASYFGDVWTLRYESPYADEVCASGVDADGNGKLACADHDCWSICSPLCTPGDTAYACAAATAPYCGDATCSPIEIGTCASDCP
jgi:hypothetical protein